MTLTIMLFVLGMDDREWFDSSSHEKNDKVFTNSYGKSWPRYAFDGIISNILCLIVFFIA